MTCHNTITTHWEGNSLVVLAHIVGMNQIAIVQASLTGTIERTIALVKEQTLVGEAETLTIADTVFNSLQTDYGWEPTTAAPGYVFRDSIDGAGAFEPGKKHQIQYEMESSDGFPIVFATEPFFVKPIIS